VGVGIGKKPQICSRNENGSMGDVENAQYSINHR